jgi:hypothetical protein
MAAAIPRRDPSLTFFGLEEMATPDEAVLFSKSDDAGGLFEALA